MRLYGEIIKSREENNIRLEHDADQSLLRDAQILRIESEIDDAQTAVLFLLECLGVTADRLYGFHSIPALLDTMLDPMGMMYDYTEDPINACWSKSDFILAFRPDGKAVAIRPTKVGYRYYCPSDNSKGFASSVFCSTLQKRCYIFRRPLTERKTVLGTFLHNVLHSLRIQDIIRLLTATGLATALGLAIPAASRYIYKTYIPKDHSSNGFLTALVIYLSVIVIRSLIYMIKFLLLSSTKVRVSMAMQSSVMAKVLHLPYSFFQDTSSGKISRRINSCSRLSDTMLDVTMDVLLNLSFSIAYLVQLRYLEAALFWPALIMIAVNIGVSMLIALLNTNNEKRLLDLDMEYTGFLYSSVRGVQKIKGLGAGIFVYSKWAEMYRRRLRLTYKQPFFLKYSTEIMAAVSILTTIVFLGISLLNELSSHDYMTFKSSFILIMTVITGLTDIMKNLFLTRFLCRNIAPIFTAANEEDEALEYVRALQGSISFENVSFAYDDDNRGCLNEISLDIRKGEKLAIVGESGCGKSTLLKVLLGLEKPDSGNVFFDGKSIQSLNQKSLRRCIGSVFQFSRLFPGTIADNIAFGNEEFADEDRLWAAADTALIGDYIRTLPLKLNTEISESNSSGFSGGQRQRLLLARAFLMNPRILVLDEATSALDNITQKQVLDNIRKMNATVIMVAHRLSTVENFDRIIMLEHGRIAEEGTYQELMDKDGRFAQLVRKQLL